VILYRLFNQGADQISEERRGQIEAELKVVQPILDQPFSCKWPRTCRLHCHTRWQQRGLCDSGAKHTINEWRNTRARLREKDVAHWCCSAQDAAFHRHMGNHNPQSDRERGLFFSQHLSAVELKWWSSFPADGRARCRSTPSVAVIGRHLSRPRHSSVFQLGRALGERTTSSDLVLPREHGGLDSNFWMAAKQGSATVQYLLDSMPRRTLPMLSLAASTPSAVLDRSSSQSRL